MKTITKAKISARWVPVGADDWDIWYWVSWKQDGEAHTARCADKETAELIKKAMDTFGVIFKKKK